MRYQWDSIKVGNTLIYLIERLNPLYLTKAIKLLYLLDENSIKETGAPFTWLNYSVWKMGPVPEDIYNIFRYNETENFQTPEILHYITITKEESNNFESFKLNSLKPFDNSEFSEYDLELIERIISNYGRYSGKELIDILHIENSLWDKIVKENNLELHFSLMNNKSNYMISFIDLLKDDEIKQLSYKSAYSSLIFDQQFLY